MVSFLTLVDGVKTLISTITTSSGIADNNKIISTNDNGKISPTLIDGFYPHPGFISGRYYPLSLTSPVSSIASQAISNNLLIGVPFLVNETVNINAVSINVTTAGVAGTVALIAVYKGFLSGISLTKLAETSINVTITGVRESTLNLILTPGWYTFCFNCSNACSISGLSSTLAGAYLLGVSSVVVNSSVNISNIRATVSASSIQPDNVIFTANNSPAPLIFIKVT